MEITQFTSFKLHQATALVDRVGDNYLHAHHGIRLAPFLVLLMVKVLGPATQQRIATALDVSRASISQRVGQLRERGLLEVGINPEDSRAQLVSLTPDGERLVTEAWAGLDQDLAEVADGVDEAVLALQLDRLIGNSVKVLGKQDTDGPAGAVSGNKSSVRPAPGRK
jgi:DNA-binding MarR family transcriptional regulator